MLLMQTHISTQTQRAPGRNEINPGQETRPAVVCNYLAFHPLASIFYPSLSVSKLECLSILHSQFFLLSNVDEQPGGHYPGAVGINGVWLQVKKQ